MSRFDGNAILVAPAPPGSPRHDSSYPEMLQIKKALNWFFRSRDCGYLIENKDSLTAEEEKKTGGPKNEGSSGNVFDNKALRKRHFGLTGNINENMILNGRVGHYPEILLKKSNLTA